MWRCVLKMALFGTAACGPAPHFACVDDGQCGADGRCEPGGSCSFPDDTCASGRRYGEYAAPSLAGACVESSGTGGAGTDSTAAADTPGADGTSATSQGSDGGGSETAVDDGTGGPSTTSTSGASTGPVAETTGETGSAAEPTFFDDFERPDAEAIGNGWWEKTPAAFRLREGRVARVDVDSGYSDNLVLRPEDETPRDVELMLTVHPLMVSPYGSPQIYARVQPGDVEVAGSVTCYLLFVTNSETLQISRQEAAAFAGNESEPLPRPLDLSAVYRLRMRITGEEPVLVDGYLEREIDGDSGWELVTEVHLVDDSPTRIDTPGRLGFSAHVELEHFEYDDFAYTSLDR